MATSTFLARPLLRQRANTLDATLMFSLSSASFCLDLLWKDAAHKLMPE
jgi:hypothetical protein